jgi:large subunit ribosomal protein L41
LTPFVAESTEKTRQTGPGSFENYPKRFTGQDYLAAWKLSGGNDEVAQQATRQRENMPTPFEEKRTSKS